MDFLFEIILEIFGEFIIQFVMELLFHYGVVSTRKTQKPMHPLLSALGYILCGALAGIMSVWIFPHSFVQDTLFKNANLILTPVLLGVTMMMIGSSRTRKGKPAIRLDTFTYGFLFAFSMSLVRYVWAA